jgi:hypothetical protein
MQPFLAHLKTNYVVVTLAAFVLAMLAHFFFQYVVRGCFLRWELMRLHRAIGRLRDRPPGQIRNELSALFQDSRMTFAWNEFEETLHEQYDLVVGERHTTAIRATLPAESFINLENVVDPRIGSEYFKHLPGILTGLGIIGTFYGLIQGLTQFDPSLSDTDQLRRSVTGLFSHVQDAFTFSALAISLAIVVTAVEKWLYSSCAKWVGRVGQALDALFRAGVGEEYLSGLLRASQDSATQVKQLKEAMVADLKELLTNLTERQIAATQQLSTDLGQRIHESLKEPLADIARTVRETSGRQSDAVGGVLEQLMMSFMAQMRETLGGQLGDLSGLMQRSAESMASVERAMQGLVRDMQRAGDDSTTGVQAAVRDLMTQLTEHQRSQSTAVSVATTGVLSQLQDALGRIAVAQEEASKRARASNEAVSLEMRNRVALISDANAATMSATRETLDKLSTISVDMFDSLSAGAASVTAAVGSLQNAIERMSRVTSELANLEGQTQRSAQSMSLASAQLATAAERVSSTVSQLGVASTRLEAVAKSATTEADARNHLLRDLQEVITKSQAASAAFAGLTQEVRGALRTGIEDFGSGVSKVLSDHLHSYQKQLGDAVGMLQGALEELAEYAGTDRK